MKIGFCFQQDWLVTQPELVKLVDELGYDGIEIWAQAFAAVGLDGVKEITRGLKTEVVSVNPYFDFTKSEESFQESLRIADEFIRYARALGCRRIRTFTSKMRSFPTSDDAEPIHWERAVRGIQAICDRGAPYGIEAVLEVHYGDGQLYDTSDAALRILREVDRPNCTINLQPPLRGEDPLESARRLGPHVTHLHAHNWIGQWGSFTFLDDPSGDVDFEQFLRILKGHGFDGWICIEHAKRDFEGVARHEIAYFRDLIARI